METRHLRIALALTATLLFGGGWLLRDAGEGAIQAWVVLSVTIGFIVLHAGDERQKRS